MTARQCWALRVLRHRAETADRKPLRPEPFARRLGRGLLLAGGDRGATGPAFEAAARVTSRRALPGQSPPPAARPPRRVIAPPRRTIAPPPRAAAAPRRAARPPRRATAPPRSTARLRPLGSPASSSACPPSSPIRTSSSLEEPRLRERQPASVHLGARSPRAATRPPRGAIPMAARGALPARRSVRPPRAAARPPRRAIPMAARGALPARRSVRVPRPPVRPPRVAARPPTCSPPSAPRATRRRRPPCRNRRSTSWHPSRRRPRRRSRRTNGSGRQ